MRTNFYKKYLFIPDLVLISIWSLFAARYSIDASINVIAIILLRLGLCFQMRDHSRWVLFSACTFLFAYMYIPGNSCFEYATQEMYYYIAYIFDKEWTISVYTDIHKSYPTYWVFALQIFWISWNMVLPVIIGIIQLFKYHKDNVYRTLATCVILSAVEIAIYCTCYACHIIISVATITFAVCPYVIWWFKHRKNGLEMIVNDRGFVTYLLITTTFAVAIIIGLRNICVLQPVALMLFPCVIYIAICRSMHKQLNLTSVTMLALSGFTFWLSLESSLVLKIFCIGASAALILLVGINMITSWHNTIIPLIFMITVPLLLNPFICGYNPYSKIYSERTRPFLKSRNARNGLFITQSNGHYGLRDRYCEILAPRYEKFDVLDDTGRIISMEIADSTFNNSGLIQRHYGIYDLQKQQYIINPDSTELDCILYTYDNTYQLYESVEEPSQIIAKLILPGYYYANYYTDPHFEPYFEDDDKPVCFFLGLGYQMGENYDGRDVSDLTFPNKHAHDIFARFVAIIHKKESPQNDINRAVAFQRFVDDSPYYRGNISLALKHIEDAIAPLNTEVNGDLTLYQAYLRGMASIQMSIAYAGLIAESYWVTDTEYRAYHNLCTALYNGHFDNMSCQGYYEDPCRHLLAKSREWFEERANDIVLETKLWEGDAIDIENGSGIKNIDDAKSLLIPFAPTKDKQYRYNKAWLEINTALNEWYEARCRVADEMEGTTKQQYIMITNQILTRHYNDISDIMSGKSL